MAGRSAAFGAARSSGGSTSNCSSVLRGVRGRGLGEEIMQGAEAIARARGCIGIWLDTCDFQAPGFYEKLGFEPFGTLDDTPPGRRRIFRRKRWHP